MSAARQYHMADAVRESVQGIAAEIGKKSVDLKSKFGNQTLQFNLASEGLHKLCRFHMMNDEAFERARLTAERDMERANSVCESPIERIVLPWLLMQDYGKTLNALPARIHIPQQDDEMPGSGVCIVPQFAFAKFRVDFAVVGRFGRHTKIIAVECDGRNFHDPKRDAARDAYLSSWGIPTVRMFGADISRDPSSLARQASMKIIEWADDVGAKYG